MKKPLSIRVTPPWQAAAAWLAAAAAHPTFALAEPPDPFATSQLAAASPAATLPCPPAAALAPLSLPEVVERALCNNPQTREAWANAKIQAAQVGVGEAAYLPSIDVAASLTRNQTSGRATINGVAASDTTYEQHSASLSLAYLLYDFGARAAALENARQSLAAANASQDATLQAVFLAALQAYYQLFTAQATLAAAAEAEKSSLESYQAAAARYRAGAATPADKLQAQTAYSQAVLNRIRAEGDARNAQGTLANVMGLDAHAPLSIAPPAAQAPDASFERDVARLIEEARQQRPDLAAAEAQLKAAQANTEAVKASGLPSFSASASLNHSDTTLSDPLRSNTLGVSVSIPLFSGFNTSYRIRAAQEQAEARLAQRDRVSQQVALDVWQAYQGLITATQSLKASADLVASAIQSERVAAGRYRAGVGNILDVLTAQSALASARQQDVQARYGWYVAKAALAQAMGRLDFAAIAPPGGTGR